MKEGKKLISQITFAISVLYFLKAAAMPFLHLRGWQFRYYESITHRYHNHQSFTIIFHHHNHQSFTIIFHRYHNHQSFTIIFHRYHNHQSLLSFERRINPSSHVGDWTTPYLQTRLAPNGVSLAIVPPRLGQFLMFKMYTCSLVHVLSIGFRKEKNISLKRDSNPTPMAWQPTMLPLKLTAPLNNGYVTFA